jgi:dTDP-4-dehydrorhamnose 3,5-epimerase-like enzyme
MRKRINNSVFDCTIIELAKIHNRAGNITVVENYTDIPFDVKRIYYLYDMPGGESRGGHAHKKLSQYLVAASGAFDVLLYDGKTKRTISLNRPYYALHIVPGIWRELSNFSSGAVCLALASELYDENDYIRDLNEFKQVKNDTSFS